MQNYNHLIYPLAACICALYLSFQRLAPYRVMAKALTLTAVAACSLHLALGGWSDLVGAGICAVIAGAIFSLVLFWGGMPLHDVLAISVVALAAGSRNTTPLLFFTAIAGAIMAFVVAEKRQKISHFQQTRIREAAHAPHEECVVASHPSIAPEVTLRRYYGHAVTIGALLTLVQAVTF